MFKLGIADATGNPATTDYLLLPLDSALAPQVDAAPMMMGSGLNLMWFSTPGRAYRVQMRSDLSPAGAWSDSSMGDIYAEDGITSVMVPLSGAQAFYRIYLLPE